MSAEDNKKSYGYDYASHPLLVQKIEPESLIALRRELALPHNKDISEKAQKQKDFETSLASIATDLGIILDGEYDLEQLCDVLATVLRKRNLLKIVRPSMLDGRLSTVRIQKNGNT